MPLSELLEFDSRRETVTTEVTRKLVEFLLAGHVELGERLPSERKLAEVLGVGRSVVREAIKPLALLGLIEVRQGDGNYLRSMESDVLPNIIEWGLLLGSRKTLDLVEARQEIEIALAGLAAARRAKDDLDAMRLELDRMHSAVDPNEFGVADANFHLLVAKAARNETLFQVLSSIRSLLEIWMKRVSAAAGLEVSASQHDPILAAIADGDAEQARSAMTTHMEWAVTHLTDSLTKERGYHPRDPQPPSS